MLIPVRTSPTSKTAICPTKKTGRCPSLGGLLQPDHTVQEELRSEARMDVADRVVVVTGGGNGIGRALCRRMAVESPRAIIVSDYDEEAAREVAAEIRGTAFTCDVSDERQVQELVRFTRKEFGRVDVFCSNAGITAKGGTDLGNDVWNNIWDVNVMSHVYAARHVVPIMLRQGEGCLLQTISAAALVTEIGSAPYSVTKRAALAFAEWLSVQHGRDGLLVSCICPMGVATEMLDEDDPIHQYLHMEALTPEQVAESVIAGLAEENFLILPHPRVAEFFELKAEDYDRWLRGMQRLNQKLTRRRANSAA